jgi:hypothetical protein
MVIVPYSNVIGNFQYLLTCTQLDLVFFINHLVQFMANLAPIHWDALRWIMRYLKNTSLRGIFINTTTKEILWLQVLLIKFVYIFKYLSFFIVIISPVLP